MKILAIEASANVASVALTDKNKLIGEYTINNLKTHSQTIMPMLQDMMDMSKIALDEIDYIAASSGPGSFTGLRIGAATAKGLALALNKKIIPVPTLDGLAYNIFDSDRAIVPIMDARRNQVYTAVYTFDKGRINRISDYMAVDIDELFSYLREANLCPLFLGDGVMAFENKIKESNLDYLLAPSNSNMQRAASFATYASDNIEQAISGENFNIMYLRKSQAEREYDERNQKNAVL